MIMSKLASLIAEKTPTYPVTIPSTGEKTTFRPFFVKEEKILLMAQESHNDTEILLAIKDIIESCVEGITEAQNYPLFDIEYLFVQLRAKSVGEVVEPILVCPDTEENIPSIKILEKRGAVIDYSNPASFYDLIVDCIELIQTKDETISSEEVPRSELEEFVDSMTKEQFNLLLDFFVTCPRLEHEVEYTASDGIKRTFVLSGLGDFFE